MADQYRVILSGRAVADLEQVFDYIFLDSPSNAVAVIERLLAAIDDLDSMPMRYKAVARSRRLGSMIRAFAVDSFVISYRVDEQPPAVWIVSVRHGSRRRPSVVN